MTDNKGSLLKYKMLRIIQEQSATRLGRGLGMRYCEDEAGPCLSLSRKGNSPSDEEVQTVIKEIERLPWPHTSPHIAEKVFVVDSAGQRHTVIRLRFQWLEMKF